MVPVRYSITEYGTQGRFAEYSPVPINSFNYPNYYRFGSSTKPITIKLSNPHFLFVYEDINDITRIKDKAAASKMQNIF
jgi:hypothetical protein